jgi:cytochrome P450
VESSTRTERPAARRPGTIRTLNALRKDAPRALLDLAANGDRIVRLRLGPLGVFLVTSPELAREVLAEREALQRGRGERRVAGRLVDRGLFASEDPLHGDQREAITPRVHGDALAPHLTAVAALAARSVERWKAGVPIDALAEMIGASHDVVLNVLFDADPDLPEGRALRGEIDATVRALEDLFLPFSRAAAAMPLPSNRRFRRARAALDRRLTAMIRERAAAVAAHGPPRDLLAALVAPPPRGAGMDTALARDEALTMVRGNSGTGTALAWSLYLLALHPDAQERLRAEASSVPDGDGSVPAGLPYAAMVFSEAMRLYPPVWVIPRVATVDQTIGGRRLRKGSRVLVSPYVLHHDARAWPDPERFDPERFDRGPFAPGQRGADWDRSGSYIPFGDGAKQCMGDELAVVVGTQVLAAVARRWRLGLAPGAEVAYAARATLKPKGLVLVPERA